MFIYLWSKNNWRISISISYHVCVCVHIYVCLCVYVCMYVILILLQHFLTWFWASLFILMMATWEYVPFSVNFVKVRLNEETIYLILWVPGKWPKLRVNVFICKRKELNLELDKKKKKVRDELTCHGSVKPRKVFAVQSVRIVSLRPTHLVETHSALHTIWVQFAGWLLVGVC